MATGGTPRASITTSSLHTAWLFQALVSAQAVLLLGATAFSALFEPYYFKIGDYRFITYLVNGLFGAGIDFIILVQWSLARRGVSNLQHTFIAEVTKATIASVMWLWLLLDSIFYKHRSYDDGPEMKVGASAACVIMVLVLFYPTAIWSWYARTADTLEGQEIGRQEESNAISEDGNTPLLPERV